MRGSFSPITGVRNRELSPLFNASWDEHSLVPWQDCLAERNDRAGVVGDGSGTSARLAVRIIREGLVHISVIVAIQSTVLEELVNPLGRM